MDGVVLDENTIRRGQVYEFDVARPPRPQQVVKQYKPPDIDFNLVQKESNLTKDSQFQFISKTEKSAPFLFNPESEQDNSQKSQIEDFSENLPAIEEKSKKSGSEYQASRIAPHRRTQLSADDMLERFRNLPASTLCPRCMREMGPCFGCRSSTTYSYSTKKKSKNGLLGQAYCEGVDCDGCGKKRIDLNAEYIDPSTGQFDPYLPQKKKKIFLQSSNCTTDFRQRSEKYKTLKHSKGSNLTTTNNLILDWIQTQLYGIFDSDLTEAKIKFNLEKLPSKPEHENIQPYYHCARCNYDLCKPCAIRTLKEEWWTQAEKLLYS